MLHPIGILPKSVDCDVGLVGPTSNQFAEKERKIGLCIMRGFLHSVI